MKRFISILILFFISVQPGFGQSHFFARGSATAGGGIAFGNYTSKNDLSGSAGAQTFTGPAITGSNTVLLIAVMQNYGSSPADPVVLYDGVNLGSPAWETTWTNYNREWAWIVVAPGSAKTVSVDIDPGVGVAIAAYYTGVNQSTPYRTATVGSGTSSPATADVTNSQANDLIVGFFSTDDDSSGFTSGNIGAGQTFRANIIGSTEEALGAFCDEPGASGTVVHSWTYGGSYGWGEIAIPLVPAS